MGILLIIRTLRIFYHQTVLRNRVQQKEKKINKALDILFLSIYCYHQEVELVLLYQQKELKDF